MSRHLSTQLKFKPSELALFVLPLLVLGAAYIGSRSRPLVVNLFSSPTPPPVLRPKVRVIKGVTTISAGQMVRVSGQENHAQALVLSPDGRKLVSSSNIVRLWDANTGALLQSWERKLTNDAFSSARVAFSPDGQRLGLGWNDGLIIWDVKSNRLLREIRLAGSPLNSFAFSPDNQSLAIAAQTGKISARNYSGSLYLWNLKTSQKQQIATAANTQFRSLYFSSSGQSLWAVAFTTQFAPTPIPTQLKGAQKRVFNVSAGYLTTFSAALKCWAPSTRTLRHQFAINNQNDSFDLGVSYSKDGQQAVIGGSMPEVVALPRANTTIFLDAKVESGISRWNVNPSPDKQMIVGAPNAGPLIFWDASTGRHIPCNTWSTLGSRSAPIFSPDGKRLFVSTSDGMIKVCDLDSVIPYLKVMRVHKDHLYLPSTLDVLRSWKIEPGSSPNQKGSPVTKPSGSSVKRAN